MSARYEWVDVEHPFFGMTYVAPGGCVEGHDTEPCDDCSPCEDGEPCCNLECTAGDECRTDTGAIVVSYDEAIVLTGSAAALRAFAERILRIVPKEGI